MKEGIKTPCIGVCSTVFGDNVCRGCKRFVHEVIDWNRYTQDQKRAIDRRLEQILTQIVTGKFLILDEKLLMSQLDTQNIVYPVYRNHYCSLYELLRAGAKQIQDTRQYGFLVLPAYRDVSLVELKDVIDREYYEFSQAYYSRYIAITV